MKPKVSEEAQKNLLLVAFHFPPSQGSTGPARTLAFARYLRQNGIDTTILTISPRAYETSSPENLKLIPKNLKVIRAFGLDARKSISVFGRYPSFLAVPDRWRSWVLGAHLKVRQIARDVKPDIVMSTYPIATAHLIGRQLAKKFGVPWVAELRDPMLQDEYPLGRANREAFRQIENHIFEEASHVLTTTAGCKHVYEKRFPNFPSKSISIIPNGFDPSIFESAKNNMQPNVCGERKILLHSGVLYPKERNPKSLFTAISKLKAAGIIDSSEVEMRFRAATNEENFRSQTNALNINDIVSFVPPIPYTEAIEELMSVDGMLLLQGSSCNDQIPAKIYEYFYSGQPFFALTDPVGDTAQLLTSVGHKYLANIDSSDDIVVKMTRFLKDLREGSTNTISKNDVMQFSRVEHARRLAKILMAL